MQWQSESAVKVQLTIYLKTQCTEILFCHSSPLMLIVTVFEINESFVIIQKNNRKLTITSIRSYELCLSCLENFTWKYDCN